MFRSANSRICAGTSNCGSRAMLQWAHETAVAARLGKYPRRRSGFCRERSWIFEAWLSELFGSSGERGALRWGRSFAAGNGGMRSVDRAALREFLDMRQVMDRYFPNLGASSLF